MINFNCPPFVATSFCYMRQSIENKKICGDGQFTKKCNEWMEHKFKAKKVMLTTSGSTALDMAALMCDIKPGDEVILPSFTFSSTANALPPPSAPAHTIRSFWKTTPMFTCCCGGIILRGISSRSTRYGITMCT